LFISISKCSIGLQTLRFCILLCASNNNWLHQWVNDGKFYPDLFSLWGKAWFFQMDMWSHKRLKYRNSNVIQNIPVHNILVKADVPWVRGWLWVPCFIQTKLFLWDICKGVPTTSRPVTFTLCCCCSVSWWNRKGNSLAVSVHSTKAVLLVQKPNSLSILTLSFAFWFV
jgi:hypothetical protein